MNQPQSHTPPQQLMLLIWESEVTRGPAGEVTLRPRTPQRDLSVAQAASILGVNEWTVRRLWKLGLLQGDKPGAVVARRSDGKASNAALKLDAASVLKRREETRRAARLEQLRFDS